MWSHSGYLGLFVIVFWIFRTICDCILDIKDYLWLYSGYLGLFVIVSWISFLIPMDVIPGRMALLVTLFLVLVNIFNTVTTNTPKVNLDKRYCQRNFWAFNKLHVSFTTESKKKFNLRWLGSYLTSCKFSKVSVI